MSVTNKSIVATALKRCRFKRGFIIRHEGTNAVKLYFRLQGEIRDDATVILFVHSLGTDSDEWRCQQDTFCSEFPTLSIDLRGFGRSSKPADSPYSYGMFADDIKTVLDALQIKNIIYVGAGLGASIGIRFANKYPSYLVKLIMCGAEPLYVSDRNIWPFALFSQTELDGIWAAIQTSYPAFAREFSETLAFPDNCKNLSKLKEYSTSVILNTPVDVFLQVIGFNNPSSFVFEDIRGQISFLTFMKIPILLLNGTSAGAAFRGATATIFAQLVMSPVFIYEFIGKGVNANATDVNLYNTVLTNFIEIDDHDKHCDVCYSIRPKTELSEI